MREPDLLVFATRGAGTNDERRILTLASRHCVEVFSFDWSRKRQSLTRLLKRLWERPPRLLVMEGTGVAGGLACLIARALGRCGYVVSSGDAVGPWVGIYQPWARPFFGIYERLLYRLASGFIGWTPYLSGRALTFGVPRAMTAAGWGDFSYDPQQFAADRKSVREQLGISPDSLTFGIVGSLIWSRRHGYCYGAELVRALIKADAPGKSVLIVGGGSGTQRLRELAGPALGRTIFIVGEVASSDVPKYMAAMDIGSLPQSVDGVGNFRYTTKVSEYAAARLPIVTGQTPMSYDLNTGWIWRLPGTAPWDPQYLSALTCLMERVTFEDVINKAGAFSSVLVDFDQERQIERATAFFGDLLTNCRR